MRVFNRRQQNIINEAAILAKIEAANEKEKAVMMSELFNRLTDELVTLGEKEIKSKDRVDITLEQYDAMKEELNVLNKRLDAYERALSRMGITNDFVEMIDPDTIQIECEAPVNPIDFTRRVNITFKINMR